MSDSYKIYASKDYVDSKALPEGAGAYQQLVTNANSEKKWEELTHYKHARIIEVKLSPANTVQKTSSSGEISYQAVNSSSANPDVFSALTAMSDDIFEHRTNGRNYAFYWDGVRYLSAVKYYPFVVEFDNNADVQVFYQSGSIHVRATFRDEKEHTFGYECYDYELKQLDEEFIPESIARKTDLPDIPETADSHMQLVTDKNGEKKWEERLGYKTTDFGTIYQSSDAYMGPLTPTVVLEKDNAYTLTIDDIEYECVAANSSFNDTPTIAILTDNNYAVHYSPDFNQSIFITPDNNAHSILIVGEKINYHPIDHKYLPFNIDLSGWYIIQGNTVTVGELNKILQGANGKVATNRIYWWHDSGHYRLIDVSIWEEGSKKMLKAIQWDGQCGYGGFYIETTTGIFHASNAQREEIRTLGSLSIGDLSTGISGRGDLIKLTPEGIVMRSSENYRMKQFSLSVNDNGMLSIQDYKDSEQAFSIPNIQTATVGQIIAVKSVDGNGKPTEWETIDPWTITSPNGTQFKLTIDDEGILSATELT